MKLSRIFTAVAALALLAAGCNHPSSGGGGGGGGSVGGGVQQSTQTITFTQPTSPVTYASGLTITLSATGGGSGNPVVFTVDATSTGKGTVSGNTLTITAAGTLVIDANQAGNSNYYAASQAQVTIVVNQATPTVSTLPTASTIAVGQTLASSTLTGGAASVPGTFAWTTPSTVPAVGTDLEGVTFTPTDATDYTPTTTSVSVIVNPITPQITALTPRSIVSDNYLYNLSSTPTYTFTGTGWQNGDILHDASGLNATLVTDTTLSLTPGQTSVGLTFQWEPGTYQPWFLTWEMQHPSGAYGNQYSTAFFGSASQSTSTCSPTTGRCFQVEQANSQIDWQDTNGTTGKFFSNVRSVAPSNIAVDDVTANVVQAFTGTSTISPNVDVYTQAGVLVCYINSPAGMSFISSVAARGGYMGLVDPTKNLVGIASMKDCTGYKTIAVAGQPWSVAMTNNGTETDAYILFRDAWGVDGKPGIVKYVVPAMTVAGKVELETLPTVSSIRASAPTEGIYQLVAFQNTPLVAVLFMADSTDGKVLLVSTNTSGSNVMAVTEATPVTELPFALATQESSTVSKLWVAYIKAAGGDNVTYAGKIDPSTGNYTPAVGTFPAGILAGGFIATATQVYGAQGSRIVSLQQQ
jgi:hypothetical protein